MNTKLELISEKPANSPRPTPLLFIHGMWHGAWCWQEYFLPYFAHHNYEAYALSLRGHSGSESGKSFRTLSLADYVSDVAGVVDQLDTAPILIGHSMGGMVTQKYLETHSAPAAVLLASVPPTGVFPATIRVALRRPWAFVRANLTMSLYPLIESPRHAKDFLFSKDMPDDQAQKYFALLGDESYRAYWDMIVFTLARPKRVKTPLLVLAAENDAAITVRENHNTAKAYRTQAEVFSNMAHNMMLEADWQKVADRILQWLGEKGL